MRAAKTDANQAAIVAVLRNLGCTVCDLSGVGDGCPDLLVGVSGRNLLMEVKDGEKPPSARQLTPAQTEWHGRWRGQVAVVCCPEEAMELVQALRNGRLE